MRSVDHLMRDVGRRTALLLAVLALGGCATVNEGMASLGQMASSMGRALSATSSAEASSSTTETPTTSEAAAPAVSERPAAVTVAAPRTAAPPVDPAVLRGPHANLAFIHHRAGRLDDAAQALERAVAASPGQPAYWNELGVVNRQLGRFDKAREAYEKALAIEPNHAAATLNLGILYDLYLWQPQQALVQYEKYLALHKGDANVSKWVADLKNRLRATATTAAVNDKEKP